MTFLFMFLPKCLLHLTNAYMQVRFRKIPGKMHRQIKNLAKNKVGVNINQFLTSEIKAFLQRYPETPLLPGDDIVGDREVWLTGLSERTYKELQQRVWMRYGLKMDRFMTTFLVMVLERYDEWEKEKQEG